MPRAFLWLLLGAALFMRAFLPQGYMPERTDSGAITVRVCGAGHALQLPTGQRNAPDDSERAEPPCAFAGLGTPVLPPPAIADIRAPEPAEPTLGHVAEPAPRPVATLLRPPVRGPPLAA